MKPIVRIIIFLLLCAGTAFPETHAQQKKSFGDLEVNKQRKKSFGDLEVNKQRRKAESAAPARKAAPSPAPARQQQSGQEQRTEVRNTPFGEETWYYNPDGSAIVITRRTCINCHGAQICPVCHGTQGRYANGMWYGCTFCAGLNGRCKTCMGKGTTMSTAFINQFGNAISYDEYGRAYLGSGASSGSGSSSSSAGSSRRNEIEPVDIVQYNVPDYTGDAQPEWCSKCKKWAYPHTHKTLR